ncbi:MAG: Uncharacterized protein Athens101428_241 [Candidatus Berkelbacteria bacterium Athens1014_28]|uniref:GlxA-like beta barrel domain-containing protein n=1 Tax=Candidatus Berkelbacteria bacterium Athens1014_28 TaxID=2017145 RepID=A0A554LP20_9BACT|nr:MAG: Uncharacterized protein Athens101428_241 [Candidatus Berkelbacteria bacterium Athens1014_28]
MSKIIYLEPDEEITDVINKISKTDSDTVSLVIPRGSTLANSVVNLKLLTKKGKEFKKNVSIVSVDKNAKNLAAQIGLPVFSSASEAKEGMSAPEITSPVAKNLPDDDQDLEVTDGIKVHQYDKDQAGAVSGEQSEIVNPTTPPEEEVIEAVKDENEILINNDSNDSIQNEEALPEKNDYKLIKKPMTKDFGQNSGGFSGPSTFGKMRQGKKRRKIIIWSIGGSVALLITLGLFATLPKAKVRISVVSEPISEQAEIKVDKSASEVNFENLTIPGKSVVKEDILEEPFVASGTKNVGKPASGKITIYNTQNSDKKSFPTGTKFSSTSGIEFVSTADAEVPGAQFIVVNNVPILQNAGKIDVAVQATSPGASGNIEPTNFTITSLEKIYQAGYNGKSTVAMSGGNDSIVKVVTDGDLANAKTSAENDLKNKIIEAIKAEISENDKLLDSAIGVSVVSGVSSAKSGDIADNFNYKVSSKVEAITFSEADFKELITKNVSSKLGEGKMIVESGNQEIKYEVTNADIAGGKISLKGSFSGYVAKKYDQAELKKEIKGKAVSTATTKLTAHEGVLSADIVISPKFLRTLPFLANRIELEFIYGTQ